MERIFYGGTVHTMAGTTAQAVAVDRGEIAAVGSDGEILALAGPGTERIDLQGACVLPGFIDSHCHLLSEDCDHWVDLRGAGSLDEIVSRGQSYLRDHTPPEGAWIRLHGYNENAFAIPAAPDRAALDRISTRHPIIASRICLHVGAANTAALEQCGFNTDTVIEGGALDRDSSDLTGGLRENALYHCLNMFPPCSEAWLEQLLAEALAARSRAGITSVHANDSTPESFTRLRRTADALRAQGRQPVRICQQVTAHSPVTLEQIAKMDRSGGDWFSFGCVKLFADGSLGGQTAALRADYADLPGSRGVLIHKAAEMTAMVRRAHSLGLQVAVHAIGDAALEQTVAAVEQAQSDGNRLGHRVVHCQFGDSDLYRRMAAAGVCADIQPPFVATDWSIVESRVGPERAAQSYAWRTLLELGVVVAGGSDSPVEPFDPLWGIYCAVTRRDRLGQPEAGWLPDQRLTVEQAARIYTAGGAAAAGQQDRLGTIEPGKLADLVALDRDILAAGPEELLDAKVLLTVVDGEIRHDGR